ncbi:hypothetical protein KCP75_12420 [Salmonella enterica subsp. enterica]|nr:hypothetical protein KCP75_12420 [Salmonella enterica subsp. enterica]
MSVKMSAIRAKNAPRRLWNCSGFAAASTRLNWGADAACRPGTYFLRAWRTRRRTVAGGNGARRQALTDGWKLRGGNRYGMGGGTIAFAIFQRIFGDSFAS